jgi:hypothetical protein
MSDLLKELNQLVSDKAKPMRATHGSRLHIKGNEPFVYKFIGETEITQGNLNENNKHFYLGDFFEKFPPEIIGGSEWDEKGVERIAIVDWGGGLVETDIAGDKKIFRNRSMARKFLANAKVGDVVVVEKLETYIYRVRFKDAAELVSDPTPVFPITPVFPTTLVDEGW